MKVKKISHSLSDEPVRAAALTFLVKIISSKIRKDKQAVKGRGKITRIM
jgi:hypothetical protein